MRLKMKYLILLTQLLLLPLLLLTNNKISYHSKYITTTPEFNKLTKDSFTVRLKQANLATKGDIAAFVKKTDFDDKLKNLSKKVTSNKLQHVLVENE